MQFSKRIENFNDTEKLLYSIWQELQKLNESTAKQPEPEPQAKSEPVRPTREATEGKPKITCKRCKQTFVGHGEFLKHSHKCKKEAHRREGTK